MKEKKNVLSIRLKDDEKALIEQSAKKEGLDVSKFIRKKLLNDASQQKNMDNKQDTLCFLFNMSTELNKLKAVSDDKCDVCIDKMMKEVNQLWQILL